MLRRAISVLAHPSPGPQEHGHLHADRSDSEGGQTPGGHHGTEVLTREELDRMLRVAGFEMVMSRVSLGRVKTIVRKAATLAA